ncbi:MAG: hypothetical protein ACREAY_06550 [Nitrososphaera sp.]|uniref:hypothetical protein n=1 Tax=Nitrososphaera sp. TaxID=1971748 RepID=UPI003D6E56C6
MGSIFLPNHVDAKNVALLERIIGDMSLEVDEVTQIIGNRYFNQCIVKAKDAIKEGKDSQLPEIMRPILDQILKMNDVKIRNEVYSELQKGVERVKDLSEELTRAKITQGEYAQRITLLNAQINGLLSQISKLNEGTSPSKEGLLEIIIQKIREFLSENPGKTESEDEDELK